MLYKAASTHGARPDERCGDLTVLRKMNSDKSGRIVWHDLFTCDVLTSKAFYRGVANWHFVTEHATQFTWGGGERDFVLGLLGSEAGAGFIESTDAQYRGWVPYVEVDNVDASAVLAEDLHGTVEKAPFEVPGVGRNCLLRDPLGALIGICLSRHDFPVPTKQFGSEHYLTKDKFFPVDFYREIFNWDIQPPKDLSVANSPIMRRHEQVALQTTAENLSDSSALWVPGLRVKPLPVTLPKIQDLGGSIVNPNQDAEIEGNCPLISDPNGTLSYLILSAG